MKNKPTIEKHSIPTSAHSGQGKIGGYDIDAYVLNDGTRVLSYRQATTLISESGGGGDLGSYVGISGLKSLITMDAVRGATIEFSVIGNPLIYKGLKAETFAEICSAFVRAGTRGQLTTRRQMEIAARCADLQDAFIKTGIVALVDEITGYRAKCEEEEYQLRVSAYINEKARAWEKTFPDELYQEWARLQGIKDWRIKPRNWAQMTNAIYDLLGPDIAAKLKEIDKNPNIDKHQYLTEHFGIAELREKIGYVVATARFCNSLPEYNEKVHFSKNKETKQLRLFW